MIQGKQILALVPARRGSKGLPLKNIRPLHGKPLLAWPIEIARGSRYIDRVILSTDDEEFAVIGRRYGAETPFLRPAELASDSAPSIDFILHAIDTLAAAGNIYDYLLVLEPTSPLTESSDVDAALETLVRRSADADAIVGVAKLVSSHPAFAVQLGGDGLILPYAARSFGQLPRRQDIDPLYALDGSLYISTIDALQRERGFCHTRTLPHVMPHEKSLEVDDLTDFILIEALMEQRTAGQGARE